jgi:hypothetical protein
MRQWDDFFRLFGRITMRNSADIVMKDVLVRVSGEFHVPMRCRRHPKPMNALLNNPKIPGTTVPSYWRRLGWDIAGGW